ncbi:DUF397 domain-containing protein [Streptomyces otsuchiensis]|uniref:DUF397 domain-containing protein n=1 Tax=Streptomyces otsuchiensis TaxID=2681388 RepID=UPI00103198B8|nr:DUF397 domain-containing protein [Streptomyces otsuchiensis]
MSANEVTWFKSSYSGGGGDNCVEVATHVAGVFVRDSKETQRQPLTVSADAWSAFTTLASDAPV